MITANQHPSYSYLAEMNKDAIIFPEFTPAFIGVGTNGTKSVAIYDFQSVCDSVSRTRRYEAI